MAAGEEQAQRCHFGHAVPEGANFCPRCGVPLPESDGTRLPTAGSEVGATGPAAFFLQDYEWHPPAAEPPSYQPPPLVKFCSACGNGLVATATICPRCGSPVAARRVTSARTRSAALLLAVLFSFFTWLYTYGEDAAKFWTGLGVNLAGAALYVALAASTSKPGWIIVWLLPALAIWLWAIVSQATKGFPRPF